MDLIRNEKCANLRLHKVHKGDEESASPEDVMKEHLLPRNVTFICRQCDGHSIGIERKNFNGTVQSQIRMYSLLPFQNMSNGGQLMSFWRFRPCASTKAVVCHEGNSARDRHYICFVRIAVTEKRGFYNDDHIEDVDEIPCDWLR